MSFLSSFFGTAPKVDLSGIIKDDAFLVDVRTPGEYAEGHVKGSVNIPLDQIPQKIASFKNKKHVVVFCRSGNRSAQAKAFLDANGIKNVVNGGTWQQVKEFVS